MVCTACRKTIPDVSKFCMYCGALLQVLESADDGGIDFVDGEIVHRSAKKRWASELLCPRCETHLTVEDRDGVEVDVCDTCEGVWYDKEELRDLLNRQARIFTREDIQEIRQAIGPPEVNREEVRYVRCPRCREHMARRTYGRFSGVVVDTCRDDGTWFDRGELQKVVDFVAKGGLELEKFEKLRAAEQRSARILGENPKPARGHLPGLLPSLFDLLP